MTDELDQLSYITLGDETEAPGEIRRVLGRWEDPAPDTVDAVRAADLVRRGLATIGQEPPSARKVRKASPSLTPDMTMPPSGEEVGDV